MSEKKYQFKLLEESANTEDNFENKTHQKVAETLFEIIRKETKGITIGLEGRWGSGKSTVISLLKGMLKKNGEESRIHFFYFDAWEHEGDPLRRVFLESLIDEVGNGRKDLSELKETISNRKKQVNTRSNQTVTRLGKLLAIAALFVPFGAAIVSSTGRQLSFENTGHIHWLFLLGTFCVFAPIYILVCNAWKIKRSGKKVFDTKYWMFLQNETRTTSTQEISEDEERSSIEFERYFEIILTSIFQGSKKDKLLLVVDNLDRIDASDSLKIWSTLQTFLQRKNPGNGGDIGYEKVWVIVPYDELGLMKLWGGINGKGEKPSEENKNSSAKSFFDKCFQLRIEVPPIVMSGWISYTQKYMKQALHSWTPEERVKAFEVLSWTRNGTNDAPTPREIKTFINQIGLLKFHLQERISVRAISFYVVHKYLKFNTNKEIEEELLNKNLPQKVHQNIFYEENIQSELAGILFGVSPELGVQLLLEGRIRLAIEQKDYGQLGDLAETHKESFWLVFNLCLENIPNIPLYAFTVFNSVWQTDKEQCNLFRNAVIVRLRPEGSIPLPLESQVEDYKALFEIIKDDKEVTYHIWKQMLVHVLEDLRTSGKSINYTLKALREINEIIDRPDTPSINGTNISYENWKKVVDLNYENNEELYRYLRMPKSFSKEIAEKITPAEPFSEGVAKMVRFAIGSGVKDWKNVIDSLLAYIKAFPSSPHKNTDIMEMFELIKLISKDNKQSLLPILNTGEFWTITFALKSNGSIREAALITAQLSNAHFEKITVPNVPNAQPTFQESKEWWTKKEQSNAKFIWNHVFSSVDFQFLWKLAEDSNNQLVGNVIEIAINEDCKQYFEVDDPYSHYINAFPLVGQESKIPLAERFIKHSGIEQIIVDQENLEVTENASEFLAFVKAGANEKILKKIARELEGLSEEQWKSSFLKETDEIPVLMALWDNKIKVEIDNSLADALLDIVREWCDDSEGVEDAQMKKIQDLKLRLNSSFQKDFSVKLTDYVIDKKFEIPERLYPYLTELMDKKRMFTEKKDQFESSLEVFLKNRNTSQLSFLAALLKSDEGSLFHPSEWLGKTLRKPFKDTIANSEEGTRQILKYLAEKMNVDLAISEETEEENKEDNTN